MRVQPGTRAIAQRRRVAGSIALLYFLEGLYLPLAQAIESISLVIENVRLLDLEPNTDDNVAVNVLVFDGRLELVNPDAVAEDRLLTRIDARGAFFAGQV